MSDFLALAQANVQKLSPYVPGKPVDELARELNLDPASIVKLASNENPLGASPQALAAIAAEVAELTRYPDGNGYNLKVKLAERAKVGIGQVTLGNGSNDILELVARAYLAPGVNAVFSEHAFAVYPIVTQAVGAEARVVPAKDWGHDLPAMLNAIDAMPEGGTLRLGIVAQHGVTQLSFSDTGKGISADMIERIFNPFVTTKASGTGLGLAKVFSIMESHGGRVECSSQPGQGASFRLFLASHAPVRP